MEKSDDIFSAIDRVSVGPSRASLSRWMRQNYAQLLARWDGQRNDWTALAAVFAANDLKDRSGNPPSAQTARKTWERIRREAERRKPRDTDTGIGPAVSRQPPPVQSPAERMAPVEPPLQRPTTSRRTFTVSTPRKDI